mmetsp:Transcript_10966/g.34849  ORF Transcript_10966/g.34849 Transcript_10966/m.34849 type:complete len:203 (+) Transcript_10966:329-937(+)
MSLPSKRNTASRRWRRSTTPLRKNSSDRASTNMPWGRAASSMRTRWVNTRPPSTARSFCPGRPLPQFRENIRTTPCTVSFCSTSMDSPLASPLALASWVTLVMTSHDSILSVDILLRLDRCTASLSIDGGTRKFPEPWPEKFPEKFPEPRITASEEFSGVIRFFSTKNGLRRAPPRGLATGVTTSPPSPITGRGGKSMMDTS